MISISKFMHLTKLLLLFHIVDQNDSSFDSLPPGEKYHLPPHEQSSSSSGAEFLQQQQKDLQEEAIGKANF